ncbi:MAG TPA: HAD family hydrolase [Verrucomicrobiae bacterium]
MKKLLITDLDNTLYDWVTFYSRAFRAMVQELSVLLGVPTEQLLTEFQAVHRRYGTSEPPFGALEIESVLNRFGNTDSKALLLHLDPAFRAFNSARKKYLKAYPYVEETLGALRAANIRIVAHTEAVFENAYYRLLKLGLADSFTHLYTIESALPHHPTGSKLLPRPPYVSVLPNSERKPNPRLVRDICAREGINPRDAAYIGDSLTRDVAMAVDAGVTAIWAHYGRSFSREDWELLVRVTHWTADDVKAEERLRHESSTKHPDFTVESFQEIRSILLPAEALT